MAQSFSSLYVHVVYSTKDRVPLLTGDLLEKMHAYTGGTINNTGCQCLTVGGVAGIHMAIGLRRLFGRTP